ncbi:futalosine hydrolase [Paenibacillus sp. CAU 1782]
MTFVEQSVEGNAPVLIVTAVEAEKSAVLRGLSRAGSEEAAVVIAAGAGPASAAAATAEALAGGRYELVISAGIAGGFPQVAPIGSLVLADAIIAADLGAESPEGFLSIDELGFGSSMVPVDAEWHTRLLSALKEAGLPVRPAPILTVTTATGTAETAGRLLHRFPAAAAEAMEGFGAALAAQRRGTPALELRAISNAIGPRDRGAWRIGEALQALENAAAAIAPALRAGRT